MIIACIELSVFSSRVVKLLLIVIVIVIVMADLSSNSNSNSNRLLEIPE